MHLLGHLILAVLSQTFRSMKEQINPDITLKLAFLSYIHDPCPPFLHVLEL